jgi:hypothetical protein
VGLAVQVRLRPLSAVGGGLSGKGLSGKGLSGNGLSGNGLSGNGRAGAAAATERRRSRARRHGLRGGPSHLGRFELRRSLTRRIPALFPL